MDFNCVVPLLGLESALPTSLQQLASPPSGLLIAMDRMKRSLQDVQDPVEMAIDSLLNLDREQVLGALQTLSQELTTVESQEAALGS